MYYVNTFLQYFPTIQSGAGISLPESFLNRAYLSTDISAITNFFQPSTKDHSPIESVVSEK